MRIEIFDDCYVELVEHWGSDAGIIEAARMSTAKGFQGWGTKHKASCASQGAIGGQGLEFIPCDCKPTGGDEKLLRYLYEHKHMTPFEMAGMVLQVQAPIFVFREWHRHRTQSYNELSARYTEMPNLFYVPSVQRMQSARQDQINKQGSGGQPFNEVEAANRRERIALCYEHARREYTDMISMGVAREVARMVIPVGQISRMRASANLRNWLQFLTLRMDPAAQWEIRQYAAAVGAIVSKVFPYTWDLFAEGKNL